MFFFLSKTLGYLTQPLVIIQRTEVNDLLSAKWQAPRCTPGGQEQLIESVDASLVVRDLFGLRVKVLSHPAEMKFHALNIGLAPNALEGLIFPQPFGEWRAIVRGMSLGTNEADRASAIDLTDSLEGSITGHSAAYDQVSVVRHGFLLRFLELSVLWIAFVASPCCDQLPAA